VQLGKSRHLLAGDRMTDEDDRSEAQRVECRRDVGYERVELAWRWRVGRRTEAASGNAHHVEAVGELRSETIKHVGGGSESGEEYKG
jgi:hypothetical protein